MSHPNIESVSANESSKRVDVKIKLTPTATHVLHLTSSQARHLSGLLAQAADDVAPKSKPEPKPKAEARPLAAEKPPAKAKAKARPKAGKKG